MLAGLLAGFPECREDLSGVKLLLVFNWYWHLNAEAKDLLMLAIRIGLMRLLLQRRMAQGGKKKHAVEMNSALCLQSSGGGREGY